MKLDEVGSVGVHGNGCYNRRDNTESRDTDVLDRVSELENRGLTIKINYLMRL